MKFVRSNQFGFILFAANTSLYHADIGDFLKTKSAELISAGFIKFDKRKPICYGKSDSLGLGLAEDDDIALLNFLQNYGFEENCANDPLEIIDKKLEDLKKRVLHLQGVRDVLDDVLNPTPYDASDDVPF